MIPSLEPQERIPFLCTAVASACAAAGALTARAAADTLFLNQYGYKYLPMMYVGTSFLVGTVAYFFGRYVSSVSISRILIISCSLLGLTAVAVRLAMLFYPWNGFRVVAYFWGDLTVNGAMLLFWSFFSQVFTFQRAKKLLGWVGAGGTLACIGAGFLIKPFAQRFGTPNLLLIVAALMVVMSLSVAFWWFKLGAASQESSTGKGPASHPGLSYYIRLLKGASIRSLALQAMVGTIVVILVDFQFKALANANFQGRELAAFFGEFYAIANILVLLIQLFALRMFLQGKGLLTSLCVLPAGMLLGGSATIILPAFAAVVVTKLVAQTTLFTIDSGAFQILYLGIKKQTRNQVRALVDGICRPAAIGLTGASLVLISGAFRVYYLSIPATVLCVVWFLLARRNYNFYLSGLIESLSARLLDISEGPHELNDKAVEEYTRQKLPTARLEELPYLLNVVQQLDHVDWSAEIRGLLQRPEPEVKIAALDYLTHWGKSGDLNEIVPLAHHPIAEVRRAAVRAAGLGGEKVMEPIRKSLDDSDPGVRAEAASALIDMGNFGGLLQGVVAVKNMLESSDKSYRVAVASPVSRLRVHGRTESLMRLLDDPEVEVRLAALRACANTPEAGLVPRVIHHLWNTKTGGAAADALIALGPLTADYLASFADTTELAGMFGRSVSMSAILTKIGSLQALEVLRRVLDFAGPASTAAMVQAYCRIVQRQPAFDPYAQHWESILRCQIDGARQRKNLLARTSSLTGNAFLMGVLQEEFDVHVGNVFALLGVLAPEVKMEALRLRLQDKEEDQRSRALEVLENVLPEKWKDEVVEMINSKASTPADANTADLLREVMDSKNTEQVLLGALYTSAFNPSQGLLPLIQNLLTHPSGVVRETALFALWRIEDPGELPKQTAQMLNDPCEAVRNLAQLIMAESPNISTKEERV